MRSVPHHKHSATIVVVGVGGVVCELSACGGRLTLLLPTLCLIVAEFATISILNIVVMLARFVMIAPSSTRGSTSRVCGFLLIVKVVVVGLPLIVLALAESASFATTLSSSSIRVQIEHVSLHIVPRLNMIFFD